MRIGIDGTGIWGLKEGAPGGVINYTINIINNLLKIDTHNKYYIYCRNEVPDQIKTFSSNVTFRSIFSNNRKLLQLITLPIVAIPHRLDLIFFPFNSSSLFSPCKSVVTIHDLHPYIIPKRFSIQHSTEVHGSSLRSTVNKIYWEKMLKIASKRADRIIAVSKSTKKDIKEIFHIPGEKIDVVYEGVDKRKFNFNNEKKDLNNFRKKYDLPGRYILCIGAHGYKNIEGSIKAFNIVKKKCGFPLHLVITGNKRMISAEVYNLVKELDLKENVKYTGWFPENDLKFLYRCADILLFPSFYEGFGLPVLEAFACGTAVVTSKMGSLPEVAGDAALIVDPHNIEEIGSSIRVLLENDHLRKKMRKKGLERIDKFSWEKAAKKTLEVFEKTCLKE